MDWQTIILAILGSGAMSAAIAAFVERRNRAAAAQDTAAAALLKTRQADTEAVAPWRQLVDELQDEVRSHRDEIARLAEVHAALRAVTDDRDKAVKENIQLRGEVNNLRVQVEHLTAQVGERDDLIRRLQAQVTMLMDRVKELEKKATGPLASSGAPAP